PETKKLMDEAARKMSDKGGNQGNPSKQGDKAGPNPGDGSNNPKRDTTASGTNPDPGGKYQDPNEAFRRRSGDMTLETFKEMKKRLTKEQMQKFNITEEELKRFEESLAQKQREQAQTKATTAQKDLERNRAGTSNLNSGTRRVETRPDAKDGGATGDAAGR